VPLTGVINYTFLFAFIFAVLLMPIFGVGQLVNTRLVTQPINSLHNDSFMVHCLNFLSFNMWPL